MSDQLDIFSLTLPKYTIKNNVRLIELFAGIGAQASALKRLGIPFEHWRVVEIDPYPLASYNAIHGTDFKPTDICELHGADLGIRERERHTYLMTYSFPCQALSLAGKREGMEKGSGTTSSLLWEVERILNECEELPQILLMENVTQVHSKKNLRAFQEFQSRLSKLGYTNYCQDLNAKDYGVPQNRNRCFMVSILGDYFYEFPKPFPLEKRLKDVLEDKVDDKYYVSQKAVEYITRQERIEKKYTEINGDIAIPVTAKGQNNWTGSFVQDQPSVQRLGGLFDKVDERRQAGSIYDPVGISPTVDTAQGGYREPMVLDEQNGYIRNDGTVGTLTTDGHSPKHNNRVVNADLRIRKLTPKECWRLMAFTDEEFEKARAVSSDSRLYMQAGNSIVVDVIKHIIGTML